MHKGHLKIKKQVMLNLFTGYIVNTAHRFIKGVVNFEKVTSGESEKNKRYLKAQYEKILDHPQFEIFRVFFIKHGNPLENPNLSARIGCEQELS